MKLKILECSVLEIEEGREYYNLQQTNLGDHFKSDVYNAINTIHASPELYPKISDQQHRCLLHRFPYGIHYAIEGDTIVILAVAHQRRKPFYWIGER